MILLSIDETGIPSLLMFPFAYWDETIPGPSASLIEQFPPEKFSLLDGSVKFEETKWTQQKGKNIARNGTVEGVVIFK